MKINYTPKPKSRDTTDLKYGAVYREEGSGRFVMRITGEHGDERIMYLDTGKWGFKRGRRFVEMNVTLEVHGEVEE